jgi:hypothetical protein
MRYIPFSPEATMDNRKRDGRTDIRGQPAPLFDKTGTSALSPSVGSGPPEGPDSRRARGVVMTFEATVM